MSATMIARDGMAQSTKGVWPYAGHSEGPPDPTPEIVEIKRLDRLRAMAPALIGSLITGDAPRGSGKSKTKTTKKSIPSHISQEPKLSYDPGPSLRQRRDGTFFSVGAAEIETENLVNEKGNVVGTRARRRDSLLDLKGRGAIDKREHDAAVRFLDLCCMASGGGLVANLLAVPGGGSRAGLPQGQVIAIGRVREVFHLLGLNNGTVFWRVVFDGRSPSWCDEVDQVRHGKSIQLLRLALVALADWQDRMSTKRT